MPSVDRLVASLRRQRAIAALLPLFFASGAASLVYQSLWAKQLHLVFGTSSFAIATVLAAFMAGLALGGLLLAARADALRRPLRIYGWMEVAIGAYALLFPWMLGRLEPLYLWMWHTGSGPVAFGAFQGVLVGAVLLLPTTLMGATLPLLARFATERVGEVGRSIGTLYAVNTAGAVLGAWLSAFVLLPWLGLWRTTLIAAAANAVLGVLSLILDRWAGAIEVERTRLQVELRLVAVAACLALAGGASLIYEVAWTRVLGLLLGPTVYAFSVMLMALLAGIAVGGAIGGRLADGALRRWGPAGVLQLLGAVEVGVALLATALVWVYAELPFWYVWLFDALGGELRPRNMWVVSTAIAGIVMAPPAVLMGVAFPLAVRATVQTRDRLGGPVGVLYGANTLGGAAGAALAGFVLLPRLQISGTLYAAALCNLAAAALVVALGLRLASRTRVAALAVAGLGVAVGVVARDLPWNAPLMTAGTHHYLSQFSDHSREGIRNFGVDSYDLLYYREGLTAVVTVGKNHDSDDVWLATNGKVDASAIGDLSTQVLLGLLPLQFVSDPADVLVIGLASGITAGSLAQSDSVQRLEIVDIEPAMEGAAALFAEHNHGVLDDPRFELVANDGRNHVLLAEPATWDIVVSEPSNPWISGVSNLFTREFFEMGRSRLKPGGAWSQWLPTYGMDTDELRAIFGAFADVFPYVAVYATHTWGADLVMVGAEHPLSPAAATLLFDEPALVAELGRIELERDLDLVAEFLMDREALLALAEGVARNTDDNMRVEYSAPNHVHLDTSVQNERMLSGNSLIPAALYADDRQSLIDLGRIYARTEDRRAAPTLRLAAQRMDPGDPQRAELLAEAERVAP